MAKLYTYAFFFLVFSIGSTAARDYACPGSIASIQQNLLSEKVGIILQDLYEELGCKSTFEPRPGKRAIMEFNAGKFDGEVFRLQVVEKSYTAEFVKSGTPLLHIKGSLWVHPDSVKRISRPIGYARGILWQEKYMKGKRGVGFDSYKEMFAAYSEGRLGGFLAANHIFSVAAQNGAFSNGPSPKHEETLFSAPIFHYLKKEYSPFMEVLSAHIKNRNIFAELASPSH